jgi:hypothetical protein
VEPCVFRKVKNELVYLLVVYVDDALILALGAEVQRIHKLCIEEFQWVPMEIGRKYSYLGAQLEFLSRAMQIDMQSYIRKILQGFAHG